MDLTEALAPKSDQANADDFIAGPRTFTVERVDEGNEQQPVNVHLVEYPGKPFRPSKSMLRVLVAGWTKDTKVWAGRKLTLYRDPDVMFSGVKVGGIRISEMSHLDKQLSVALTVTRGNKKPFKVQPLKESAPQSDPIEQSLRDAWNDVDRLQKAVKWMADNGHPLHEKAASRLAELQETGEVAEP